MDRIVLSDFAVQGLHYSPLDISEHVLQERAHEAPSSCLKQNRLVDRPCINGHLDLKKGIS